MAPLYYVKYYFKGQPATMHIADGQTFQVYVDTEGGKEPQLSYGSIMIPIDSVDNYKDYPNLPDTSLRCYFEELISRVFERMYDNTSICNISEIQQEVQTEYWDLWSSKGYVNGEGKKPLPIRVMGKKYPDKKRKK